MFEKIAKWFLDKTEREIFAKEEVKTINFDEELLHEENFDSFVTLIRENFDEYKE